MAMDNQRFWTLLALIQLIWADYQIYLSTPFDTTA